MVQSRMNFARELLLINPVVQQISDTQIDVQEEEFDLQDNFLELEVPVIDLENEPYLIPYRKYAEEFQSPIIPETILSDCSFRFTTYPIQYKAIWDNYKQQQARNWTVGEISMASDLYDWNKKLNKKDRFFLERILAFFAAFDGIVNLNIKENLIDVIKIKESECAYGEQFRMEEIHGEMYAIMLDLFIEDPIRREKLKNSIGTIASVKKKAEWAKKHIESDKTFAHALIAFTIVEGVYFSGAFASIFWMKTRDTKILPGLMKSNRFIAKDEALHVQNAYLTYRELKNKLKQEIVHEMFEEAVKIEDEFINESLPCRMIGMNADLMRQYIRYTADRLLVQLGYEKLYRVTSPFKFMEKIDLYAKENFFEEKPDNYFKATVDAHQVYIVDDPNINLLPEDDKKKVMTDLVTFLDNRG